MSLPSKVRREEMGGMTWIVGDRPDAEEIARLEAEYGVGAVLGFMLGVEAEASRQAEGWHSMAANLRNMGGGSIGVRARIAEGLLWGLWRTGGYRGEVQPLDEAVAKSC